MSGKFPGSQYKYPVFTKTTKIFVSLPSGSRPIISGNLQWIQYPYLNKYCQCNTYVSLRLRVQNGISCLISALCVNCLISIPEYSRIRLRVQNGISRLISALCVNCLISIPEYSRIIDYSIIWLSTCITVFNTC